MAALVALEVKFSHRLGPHVVGTYGSGGGLITGMGSEKLTDARDRLVSLAKQHDLRVSVCRNWAYREETQ
jgi:hypothetical protein